MLIMGRIQVGMGFGWGMVWIRNINIQNAKIWGFGVGMEADRRWNRYIESTN